MVVMKIMIDFLKGIRVIVSMIVFIPISIVGLIALLGDKGDVMTNDMPDWFTKSFEYVAGITKE